MRIEKKDLEVLRKLELGLDLIKGIPDQIKKFESEKVIESFGIRFFLPQIVGGKWFFVLVRMNGIDSNMVERLEFPVEMGINLSIPKDLLPTLTTSFYTQDPKHEEEIIKALIKYVSRQSL